MCARAQGTRLFVAERWQAERKNNLRLLWHISTLHFCRCFAFQFILALHIKQRTLKLDLSISIYLYIQHIYIQYLFANCIVLMHDLYQYLILITNATATALQFIRNQFSLSLGFSSLYFILYYNIFYFYLFETHSEISFSFRLIRYSKMRAKFVTVAFRCEFTSEFFTYIHIYSIYILGWGRIYT